MTDSVFVLRSGHVPWFGWRLRHPVAAAALLALVLYLVWALFLARDAGDLAAQYAWAGFVIKYPGSAYNLSWYGGMHPASYSLVSPYVMGLIGVRTTGTLAGLLSSICAAVLLMRAGIRRPLAPALWLTVALWCNVAAGRITFALGMLFVLTAAVVLFHDRVPRVSRLMVAAASGAVATMCSPVAGLFIEVLAAALILTHRRKDGYLLAAGPPLVIGITSALFPFYGVQPFPWFAALVTTASAITVAVLVPSQWRIVRAGAWVYAAGVVLSWAIPSPIGSNVERMTLLFSAGLLLCGALAHRTGSRKAIATYTAFAAVAVWTIIQPVDGFIATTPAAGTIAQSKSLISELQHIGADRGRIEVVPLKSHWEAVAIAPYVNLARGWNRQADVERNPVFYTGTLTTAGYRTWLHEWAVGFVVLPTDRPDDAGVAEAKIVALEPSWLTRVWEDADWRVYRVNDAEPMAAPPATVTYAGPAEITVNVPTPGPVLLRITWSPWLRIDNTLPSDPAHGCLSQDGQWTRLDARAPGTYTISTRYVLALGTPCSKGDTTQ